MSLSFRTLRGHAIDEALDDLARLRINVFREYPYLYDGEASYERRYLATYKDNPEAILVVALDGGTIVRASTGTPLTQHDAAFVSPVRAAGLEPSQVFYCAESVLLPAYRGRGAGHVFFDLREEHAQSLGAHWSVFCAVERPPSHPVRPDGYRPLDGFWRKRGYKPMPDVFARFLWKEIGDQDESEHKLGFWSKKLT